MSTVTATAATPRPAVTLPRVLRSEWTKLWSLRSTRVALAFAVIAQIGLGCVIAAASHSAPSVSAGVDRSLAGDNLSQLAIAVLGVLVISGEYATGSIKSTFMAVPTRLPVLSAKLLVFAAIVFCLMLPASFVAILVAPTLGGWHAVTLTAPGAVRTVFGNALFLTLVGVLCIGFATIIRATAGGIAAFVLAFFILTPVVGVLPASLGNAIAPYIPLNAGSAIEHLTRDAHSLTPWTGFAVFCGYAAVTVAVGAYLLRVRDA